MRVSGHVSRLITDASGRAHRQLIDSVMSELSVCESMLGESADLTYHISDIHDPLMRLAARAEYARRRDAALTNLDTLKTREDRSGC